MRIPALAGMHCIGWLFRAWISRTKVPNGNIGPRRGDDGVVKAEV
jgi:hypothetical protein